MFTEVRFEKTGKRAVLLKQVQFNVNGVIYTIQAGFQWDGASIPWFAWTPLALNPFHERVRRASLLHDYLRRNGFDSKWADRLYFKMTLEDGANYYQAGVMYFFIRAKVYFTKLRNWLS